MNQLKNIEDAYTLSPMQQGMLFHSLYTSESKAYVEQFSYELEGQLNLAAFEQAWQQVLSRHSALRTAFVWENIEQPHQIVCKKAKLPWHYHDWRKLTPDRQEDKLEDLLIRDRTTGFSLSRVPLMRLHLIHLTEDKYQLIWSYHHLILDGWSLSLLLKEVMDVYQAAKDNRELKLAAPAPYRNYIAWLKQQDQSQAAAFWQQELQGFTSPTPLGIDLLTPVTEASDQEEQELQLSPTQTTALQTLAKQHKTTLNTIMQGIWALILGCYSQRDDLIFGVTSSGRPADLPAAASTVGLFINTLPLRVQLEAEAFFFSWLQQLQNKQIAIRQYEYSSLSEIQGWSEVPKGIPLFESIVIFQNLLVDTSVQEWIASLKIRNTQAVQQTNYPLNVIVELAPNLTIKIAYDRARFQPDAIARLLGHWQNLIDSIIAQPQIKLAELSLLTTAEKHKLLVEWNNTKVDYLATSNIQQLFEQQVARTPNATAVVFKEQQLTYQQLNQKANQLAHYLKKNLGGRRQERCDPAEVSSASVRHELLGKPQKTRTWERAPREAEVLVGICVDRSLDTIVGILGILKAGAAYLPIDPNYPQERIDRILSDAGISLLLTQAKLKEQLASVETICLDEDWQIISQESISNLQSDVTLSNLAYCIYTSGSTGIPKGVMIQHDSLVNFVCAAVEQYQITDRDRVLQFASISFDVAVEEIYPSLITGGTVILATEEMFASAEAFIAQCQSLELTVLDLPTAYWQQIVNEIANSNLKLPECVRLVIIGGEQATAKAVAQWQSQGGEFPQLINAYGPTEATVETTLYRLPNKEQLPTRLPIGSALPNVEVYVLDRELQPVPEGIIGELYIGGAGLARGYLNRPSLTAEKFIPHPFSSESGSRLYRTGDLVRYVEERTFEFLGRVDQQVKVRGYRLELGEVETALNQHSAVDESVVVLQEDDFGNKNLTGYVTLSPNTSVTNAQLRQFLQTKLPHYAVPKAVMVLAELPLTTSGKIDRRALPAPDFTQLLSPSNYVAPVSPSEKILAQVWSEILGIERIGVHDNFFEIGGDSIVSIQIVAKANRVGLKLEPRQLFQHQTIAELAKFARIKHSNTAESETLVIGLTPFQQQFLEQNQLQPKFYNQLQVIELEAKPKLLEQALKQVIQRHDALSLGFAEYQSGWQQVYSSVNPKSFLTTIDLSALTATQQQSAIASVTAELQHNLDLASSTPLQLVLFELGIKSPSHLLIVSNCLAIDRTSREIILEDLQTSYQQISRGEEIHLPPKTTSFQQWSQYLVDDRSSALLSDQNYWLTQLQQPFHSLPIDDKPQKDQPAKTDIVSSWLTKQVTQALTEQIHNAYNTQIEDVLLTALIQTFAQWTTKSPLSIDIISHRRVALSPEIDLSRTVGQFTTAYPVFFDLATVTASGDVLIAVKEHLRRVPHHGLSYSLLRYSDRLPEIKSQLQALPPPEVSFAYLGQVEPVLAPNLNPVIKPAYLLEIQGMIVDEKFHCQWKYNSNVYRRDTIETLASNFELALNNLITHCQSLETKRYTASDFPKANLSQQKLDQFLAKINQTSN